MREHYSEYKKLKKNLINEYKKNSPENIDSFISIDNFLANKKSKGPSESEGDINYYFNMWENLHNFIFILINYYGFDKILCVPDVATKYGENYIEKISCVYNMLKKELLVPVNLKNGLKFCMMNPNIRFVYCVLIITQNKTEISRCEISHANILIFDLFKKTIERYEPHGKFFYYSSHDNNQKVAKEIDDVINIKLLPFLELSDFEYLSPVNNSLLYGLQIKADAFGGLCVTYTMMYLHLRLMNPDVKQSEILNYFIKKYKKLKDAVLKYVKFIELELKKHSSEIKQITHDLRFIEWNNIRNYVILHVTNNDIHFQRRILSKKKVKKSK